MSMLVTLPSTKLVEPCTINSILAVRLPAELRYPPSLTYMIISTAKEGVLKKLQPANMDGSKRMPGCLENTRIELLTLILQWASDPTSTHSVLWLHGPAGSGKSAISTTLADRFRQSRQLGAFLFFDRDVTERSNPALV